MVYPNPAQNIVQLSTEGLPTGSYNLSIYTQTGQEVLSKRVTLTSQSNSESIDVSDFAKGTYLLKLTQNDFYIETKLIIN